MSSTQTAITTAAGTGTATGSSTGSGAAFGTGTAPVHHGELLQGAFTGPSGAPVRALVTLPCPLHTTRATFTPVPGGEVTVSPPWKEKARRAAELTLDGLRLRTGGRLDLVGDAPTGRGFGSSTSDVLAAVRAVRDAFGAPLTAREAARLAVRAETASDALMFEATAVLFAQREGTVVEDFGHRLPPLHVLGFGSRADGHGVNTLALPAPRYDSAEIARFDRLRVLLRRALRAQDAALLGAVATRSALLNQRRLPVPGLDRLLTTARACGALGLQIAHSGDIAAFLFAPEPPEARTPRTTRARELLRGAGVEECWEFAVGAAPR
ncbi:kinase [Streptomyces sp. NPDC051677]|uniref:GHMP family kinase ATP-binding protein n=1 Tax=Streptomyces sp. NPDC051677 TaxID=3365669 RepID=UPI0037D176CE